VDILAGDKELERALLREAQRLMNEEGLSSEQAAERVVFSSVAALERIGHHMTPGQQLALQRAMDDLLQARS
jgi:hypothetical protein